MNLMTGNSFLVQLWTELLPLPLESGQQNVQGDFKSFCGIFEDQKSSSFDIFGG